MGEATIEKTEFTGEFDYSVLVGCLSCFDFVSDTGTFFKWLHATYPDIKDAVILDGYKYFIELFIGMIANSLKDSDGVNLNDHDIMFDRALSHGVAPDETQPINYLGKLFVILQKRVEEVKATVNTQQFRGLVKKINSEIISVFRNYVEANSINASPFSNEEGKLWCMRAFVWVFLVDIRSEVPQAHIFNPLHSSRPEDVIEEGTPEFDLLEYQLYEEDTILCGFCYVLEYLLNKIFPNYLNNEMLTRLHTAENWKAVDLFYSNLHNDFFTEGKEEYMWAWYFHIFNAQSPIQNEVLTPILQEYKEPQLSLTEQLEQIFLWYDIGFLDASSNSFTGHVTFTTLLDGIVKNRMAVSNPDPIQVRVIKHPTYDGNYYSYALLIERYGLNTDYSGWIVCYSCSTDFSGTGGYYNDVIQDKLEEYESMLEIKEYSVDEIQFKRFCLERDVSSKEDIIGQQLSELEYMKLVVSEYKEKIHGFNRDSKVLLDKIESARGLITELLTYYHKSQELTESIDWNVTQKSNELDVIYSVDDEKSMIIECKYSDHIDLEDEFRKLAKKINECTIFGKKPDGVFYFYHRLRPKTEILYSQLMDQYRREGVVIHNCVVISDMLKEGKYSKSIWNGKKLKKVDYLMNK